MYLLTYLITAQGLPEPSSLRGSALGTRAAEHKGCNWACKLADGCSLKSCARPHLLAYATEKSQLNCMQRLCDWVKGCSITVSYIHIYIYTLRTHFSLRIFTLSILLYSQYVPMYSGAQVHSSGALGLHVPPCWHGSLSHIPVKYFKFRGENDNNITMQHQQSVELFLLLLCSHIEISEHNCRLVPYNLQKIGRDKNRRQHSCVSL